MKKLVIQFTGILAMPVLLAGLTACSSIEVSKFASERMIAVDGDGFPYPYSVKTGSTAIPKSKFNYDRHLDRIVESIKRSGRKKILIHAFGGLNNLDETIGYTEKYSRTISKESDFYPIFICWKSSLFDAYFDHLFFIRRGRTSYFSGPMLSPFYFLMDITRAVSRLPVNLVYQSYGLFYDDYGEEFDDVEIREEMKKKGIRAYIGHDNSSIYKKIGLSSVYIVCFPIRIVTTPLIDAFGKSAWDVMKRRTRTAFYPVHPLEITRKDKIKFALFPEKGALAKLMDKLSVLYQTDKSYSFTLIGHSMGPLLINGILEQYNTLPYENIVYLAAACSIRNSMDAVVPYLRNHPQSTFYNLCLHPEADHINTMFLGLPRGSVLEWVDSYFSDPVSPEDLVIGSWSNAIQIVPRRTVSVRSQVVLKAFGINDPKTNTVQIDMPQDHVEISGLKVKFWKEKFWKIPANNPQK